MARKPKGKSLGPVAVRNSQPEKGGQLRIKERRTEDRVRCSASFEFFEISAT
jgi:hypothetical protein